MSELERIESFLHGISERASTEVVPFDGGVAFLNSNFPIIWDMNFLTVQSPEGMTVERLLAAADDILGSRALKHRKAEVMFAPEGAVLAEGFEKLEGWTVNKLITMKLTGSPDRDLVPGIAEEVTYDELRSFREEGVRRGPYAGNEDDVRQLVDKNRVWHDVTTTRHFAARIDGRIVSGCDLYLDGAIGQIEDVETFQEAQNKGMARAVVGTAAAAAEAAGCNLIFLNADDDDWPKLLYRKLGFEAIGTFFHFLKTPEESRRTQ